MVSHPIIQCFLPYAVLARQDLVVAASAGEELEVCLATGTRYSLAAK